LREYIAYINSAETLEAMTITFAEDGDNVNILVGWRIAWRHCLLLSSKGSTNKQVLNLDNI